MLPVLVHIGYHKTGSSFLQGHFARHTGVHYVPRPEVRARLLEASPLRLDVADTRRWIEDVDARARAAGVGTIVMSEEELSGNVHTHGSGGFVPKAVAEHMRAALPEARVAIVVRNQGDAIESAYRQYVKMGGTLPLRHYLRPGTERIKRHRFPQFSLEHFEYDALVGHYQSLFGAERVHVFLYEELRSDQERFLADFCERTRLPRMETALPEAPANVSWAYGCIVLARLTNRLYGADPINRRVVAGLPPALWYRPLRRTYARVSGVGWVRRIGAGRKFLRGELRDTVERHFGPSNRRLAELLDVDLAARGYA